MPPTSRSVEVDVRRKIAVMVAVLTLGVVTIPLTATPAAAACTPPPLGFELTLTKGDLRLGPNARTGNLAASGCGRIGIFPFELFDTFIEPDDLSFEPARTRISLLRLRTTPRVVDQLRGDVTFDTGTVDFRTAMPMELELRVAGFRCVIGPFTPDLTTGTSGDLVGETMTEQSHLAFAGKLVANEFEVPAIQPSSTCPWLAAAILNWIIGLPLASGVASLTFDSDFVVPPN
jgi:hypothetical protein